MIFFTPSDHFLNILKSGLTECSVFVLNQVVINRKTYVIKSPFRDPADIRFYDKCIEPLCRIITLRKPAAKVNTMLKPIPSYRICHFAYPFKRCPFSHPVQICTASHCRQNTWKMCSFYNPIFVMMPSTVTPGWVTYSRMICSAVSGSRPYFSAIV